jgi:CubicO group peptidase (beta-lactamase class C family)
MQPACGIFCIKQPSPVQILTLYRFTIICPDGRHMYLRIDEVLMFRTLAASFLMMSASVAFAETKPDLTAEQTERIDRYVQAEMARQRIPGLTLGIYKNGDAVLTKGYGLANVELNVPMRADSVLQSGSVGKSFTATAIMMLVEQGKIHLDDSITKYFPEAPESWKPVKVANLLSHTSGLAAYDTPELQKAGGPFDLRSDFSEAEMVKKIAKLPLDFKAGEGWSYENTNFVLLGIMIHRVSGQHYSAFLRDHVFTPLGMKASRIISDTDIIPNRSAGYEIIGGILRNQEWVSPTFNSTADGTIYFTVKDIEHWDRALSGEKLLKKESLQKMWTPYPYGGKTADEGYGFGWEIHFVNGHKVIEHDGAWQGFATSYSRYVDDKLTVVVLTNLDSDHSNPAIVVRAVAGIVEPELEVAPRQAMTDDKAAFTHNLWTDFQALIKSSDAIARVGNKVLSAEALADLRASLPDGWADKVPELIARTKDDKNIKSVYKIGRDNNKRLLEVTSNAGDEVTAFVVSADPDNR